MEERFQASRFRDLLLAPEKEMETPKPLTLNIVVLGHYIHGCQLGMEG